MRKNWPVGEKRSIACEILFSQRETKNTRRFSFGNVAVAVAVRFPLSHVIYVKHREAASRRVAMRPKFVRSTFRRRSCGLLVWDANHAAFSAVGPTARGPTFPPPFPPLLLHDSHYFRGLLVPLLLSLSLSFFLESRPCNRVPRKRI